jgi:hypothetical protein
MPLVGKTGGNFYRATANVQIDSKSLYSARKSWKLDDNVIGCLRDRIEVVWEIKVMLCQ